MAQVAQPFQNFFIFLAIEKSYKNHESPVPVDQKGTSASIGTSTAKPK